MLVLALALVFTLFACGDKTCKHKDEDEDGLCDDCDECLECIDEDEDGLCDNCGECLECVDEDEDGFCDNCEEEMEEGGASSGDGIALIEDGEILFQVVLGSDITSSVKMTMDSYADALEAIDVTLSVVGETSEEADLEVLIGTVTSRGKDYEYDKYSLGGNGYIISAVDETKIIINGGSETALVNAFTMFFEDMLGITDDVEEIEDFYFGEDHETVEIQSDYRIDSISVGTSDLKGYTISRSRGDGIPEAIPEKLQKFFYEKAGYYLPIVDTDDAGDKTIAFTFVKKGKAGPNGFRVVEDGSSLIIECAHMGKYEEAFNEFYSSFSMKQGDIVLGKFEGEKDYSSVYYSDFGAKGDGKTNDTDAIRSAHTEANKNNQTVYAEKGKTYLIEKVMPPITIKTDVDWKGCKFIFDASKFQPTDSGNVFVIDNTGAPLNFYTKDDPVLKRFNESVGEDGLVIRSVNHGDNQTTKFDVGVREPLMLKVYNSDARAYIRWGYVDTKGGAQCEVIVVDENGNIDPSTPFLLDYEKITQIVAYRINADEPITVKNASIESRNSLVNLLGGYKSIAHGIQISRNNVTVENIIHTVTQEFIESTPTRKNEATGLWQDVSSEGFKIENGIVYQNGKKYNGGDVHPFTGYSYSGIIQVSNAHNTLVKNCGFQARYHYEEGTYDISCSYANQLTFEGCTQNNFFQKDANGNDTSVSNIGTYWGVAGTNYCKNMFYVDSVLTRYDAHCGVFNGGIKGGKLAVLRLIGGGTFTIEGVDFHARGVPIQLREDYGATFNGTVIVKDTVFNYIWGGTNYDFVLVDAPTAHIYNGYATYFPNLIVDNITVKTDHDSIRLVNITNQVYSKAGDHYPSRCPIRDDVSNPDALFTYYFETANKTIVEDEPAKFPFLEGFKKVNKEASTLKAGEYTVVDNGNGTYTVVAEGVKNVQPYNAPKFIEIKNMKNAKNVKGKPLQITLYDSPFFENTEIIDEDKVLKLIKAPKK